MLSKHLALYIILSALSWIICVLLCPNVSL